MKPGTPSVKQLDPIASRTRSRSAYCTMMRPCQIRLRTFDSCSAGELIVPVRIDDRQAVSRPVPTPLLIAEDLVRGHDDLRRHFPLRLERRVSAIGIEVADLLGHAPHLHGLTRGQNQPADVQVGEGSSAELEPEPECRAAGSVHQVRLRGGVALDRTRREGDERCHRVERLAAGRIGRREVIDMAIEIRRVRRSCHSAAVIWSTVRYQLHWIPCRPSMMSFAWSSLSRPRPLTHHWTIIRKSPSRECAVAAPETTMSQTSQTC